MSIHYIYIYNKDAFYLTCPESTIPDYNQHHNEPVNLDSLWNRASLYIIKHWSSKLITTHCRDPAHGNTDDVRTQCCDARRKVVNVQSWFIFKKASNMRYCFSIHYYEVIMWLILETIWFLLKYLIESNNVILYQLGGDN